MKIYKYYLKVTDTQTIKMLESATILSLQVQDGIPCIWATVPSTPFDIHGNEVVDSNRHFVTVGTGHIFNEDNLIYIGTYQLGNFVGHVFEDRSVR